MAPALGLLLHECCYSSYNDRWASDGGDGREPLQLTGPPPLTPSR